MKNIYFLLLSFSIFLVSCSKSKDVAPQSIIGKWSLTGISVDIDSKVLKASSKSLLDSELQNAIFEFTKDNKYIVDGETAAYQYTPASGEVIITYDDKSTEKYTADLRNSTLRLLTPKVNLEPAKPYAEGSPENDILLGFFFLFIDQEAELNKLTSFNNLQLIYEFKK
jgi:hypothetical protein